MEAYLGRKYPHGTLSVVFTKKQQYFFVNKNNNSWLLRYNEQLTCFQNATLVWGAKREALAFSPYLEALAPSMP
jgi:hypothetical protein